MEFEIRPIKEDELPLMRDFAPADWNTNLEKVYGRFYGQPWFHPLVVLDATEIIGTGVAMIYPNAAWLGTIIVKDEYRSRGIGRFITTELIKTVKTKGIDAIILAASSMGLPIYQKLGFTHDLNYLFFKKDGPFHPDFEKENISPITPQDHAAILSIDRRVSGEDRKGLLLHMMDTGFKFTQQGKHGKQGAIDGYFLPDFGKGLIIATTDRVGLELLKFKISGDQSPVVIPETNKAVLEFLVNNGYTHYQTSPRMFLENNVTWDSQRIYARGSGYLG